MQLSLDQLRIVERDVQDEGISYSHLEYDLLDHVCCDIEDRMHSGISFNDAYQAVKREIGLQGLRRVQQETLLLINKNYRMMKRSMKTLGTIALAGISIAALAKLMHWPYASILIVLSTFTVSTIFFPAALYVWYKEVFQKKNGFIVILAFFGGFTFMYGTLFKLMHWPLANILLAIGELLTILTIIIGGISYLISRRSQTGSKTLTITGITGIVLFFLGTLFKLEHWPGASMMLILGAIILFSIFLPVYAYKAYNEEKTIKNSFIFSVFALTFIISFTFLLSLNSSRSILDGFVYMDNGLQKTLAIVENQIDNQQIDGNNQEINIAADEIFNSIDDLKNDLIVANGGLDVVPKKLKRSDLEHLKFIRSNETVRNILEGKAQDGKAYDLYYNIQKYKSLISETSEIDLVSKNFSIGILQLQQDNPKDWIIDNFYKVPLVTSISNLTHLQLDIRLTQQQFLICIDKTVAQNQEENNK
ncbi:MAG: hypothetical protein JEY96_04600 [Bacteroidales bacterium]|nr:hypothetical protein [Bacteroidales bacterium]